MAVLTQLAREVLAEVFFDSERENDPNLLGAIFEIDQRLGQSTDSEAETIVTTSVLPQQIIDAWRHEFRMRMEHFVLEYVAWLPLSDRQSLLESLASSPSMAAFLHNHAAFGEFLESKNTLYSLAK